MKLNKIIIPLLLTCAFIPFGGCKTDDQTTDDLFIKTTSFQELAYYAPNIFIGTVTKLGDKEEAKKNCSCQYVASNWAIFPITIAVSEVMQGEIEAETEIVKHVPLWYADELKVGTQCLFALDTYYRNSPGNVFQVLKIEDGKLIPYVEEQEVPYVETSAAFRKLPKTLEEAKEVINEKIALKAKHNETSNSSSPYTVPSDIDSNVIDPFRDPNG